MEYLTVVAPVALAIAALAVVVLCIFVPLFLCLWCKTRRELEILKRRVESEGVVGRKDHHISTEFAEYTKEPPPGTYSHLEHPPPSPIKPRSKDIASNYSAVNNLAILPDELRTPENLEQGQLPKENAQQMFDEYKKKREQYEEAQLASSLPQSEQQMLPRTEPPPHGHKSVVAQLSSHAPPRAPPGYEEVDPIESSSKTVSEVKEISSKPSPQVFSRPTPGYEDIDPIEPLGTSVEQPSKKKRLPRADNYNNPIDCLPPNHPLSDQITGKPSSQPKKTFKLSASSDDYTEVFDSLATTSMGGVGAPLPQVRATSDSRSPKDKVRNSYGGTPTQFERIYENGLKEDPPSSVPGGSLENVTGLEERGNPLRQSKRDSGKEVVELDFTKKRFRVASKTSKQGDLARDMTDGETSPKAGSPKKTDLEESYAMVNLADKQRYRAESDSMKKEGSGIPGHYGPEERTVVTMST